MGNFRIPGPENEPVFSYAPGSPERDRLVKELGAIKKTKIDIPMIIGGKEIFTDNKVEISAPHDHKLVLGQYSKGGKKEVLAQMKKVEERVRYH